MPWKITEPMDQKIQLIADRQKEQYSITDLSKKYGVSRKTIYKWCARYEEVGIDGLKDQDRTPKHSPNKTTDDILKLLINEKLKNRKRGPKKIYYQLKQQYPGLELPVPSTIAHWLKKNGLVNKRKKRIRVPPYTEPFIAAQSPNDVWSADYKGQFYTKNNRACYPLTISDNYSRYLLKCAGLPGPRYSLTRDVFEETFREYGLPGAIRMDNGTPFAGKCVGGLSRLSIWWIRLGITPERIDKGCPQQNGRHERMHRTLKLEAIDTTTLSMREQQKLFDWFLCDYNNHRPHESLNNEPPINYYNKSSRPYVEKTPPIEYGLDYTVRSIRHDGYLKFNGQLYYLTDLLHKERVALKEFADGQWKIFYSFYPIAILDLRQNRVLKLN
jgi:transposase InsO family protein